MKNTNCFHLNFYGNIQSTDMDDSNIFTQSKREYKKSQKRQLEELVVPVEVYKFISNTLYYKALILCILTIVLFRRKMKWVIMNCNCL